MYTLYIYFLANFTEKFGEWMRLTCQAILVINSFESSSSSSSSFSATKLAECIRQAAVHTLGRLNEIHETTKMGLTGQSSSASTGGSVVASDLVTSQMDLDVESCVAQVQEILGMVARVLTASLFKKRDGGGRGGGNTKTSAAATLLQDTNKIPTTATVVNSHFNELVIDPIFSRDNVEEVEGEEEEEEEGEKTPTALTSQSDFTVVKSNKKLE